MSNTAGFGSFDCRGCIPDPVMGAKHLRDLYESASASAGERAPCWRCTRPCSSTAGLSPLPGKYTVPVLWDRKLGTIVNNESSEIMRIFNSQFNHLADNPDLDLYPGAWQWTAPALPCLLL